MKRPHQDQTAPKGYASLEQMALVHLPISIEKAMKIPEAKQAVDAEWTAHAQKRTWNVDRVRPRAEVIAEANRRKVSVHFGRLMDLCHLKHAELDERVQKYKGRVVFRGDQVKDETGLHAVFTEQGASASQMAAAKFLDTIARMPGMSGQAADAVKAYTQVPLKKAHKLLGLPPEQCPETWISLPRSRQPQAWANVIDPVCPLERNLYGHPLAGLLWERYLEDALFEMKWEKLPGWECLYVHRDQQLFLSVYVDDFKMVGKTENIPKMWKAMQRKMDLEPETELSDNVYLGCNQRVAEPNQQLLHEKNRLFKKLTTHEKVEAEGDLSVPEEDQKPKRGKKKSEAAGDRGKKQAKGDPSAAGDRGYPQACLVH